MEYRRRSSSARRAASRRHSAPKTHSNAGRIVVSLLIIAGIVYLISASAAGTWIAENIMTPIVSTLFDSAEKTPSDIDTDNISDTAASSISSDTFELSASGTPEPTSTVDIEFPKIKSYMLQMGVYSESANADTQAASLKKLGAGGYVYPDNQRYRVMASAYCDEESAKEVKDRLVAENVDCTIHAVESNAITFRVTAAESKLNEMKKGFGAISVLHESLYNAVIAFDRDTQEVSTGQAAVSTIQGEFLAAIEPLRAYSADQNVIARLVSCCSEIESALELLIHGDFNNTVDFSSKMKYTQIYIIHEYIMLMESLSSDA